MQKPHRIHGWRLVDRCPNAGARASSVCAHRAVRRGLRPVELPLVGAPDVSRHAPSHDECASFPSEGAPAPRMQQGRLGVAPILGRRTGRSAGVHKAAPASPHAGDLHRWRPPLHAAHLDGEEMLRAADAVEGAVRAAEAVGTHTRCVDLRKRGPATRTRACSPHDVDSAEIGRPVGADRNASAKQASVPPATGVKNVRPGGVRPIGARIARRASRFGAKARGSLQPNRTMKAGDVVVTLPGVPVSSAFDGSMKVCPATAASTLSFSPLLRSAARLFHVDTLLGKKRRSSRLDLNSEEKGPGVENNPGDLEHFDPIFYGIYYRDLNDISDVDILETHFRRHGRQEGRFRNSQEYILSLEVRFGKLPKDFDPDSYRAINRDLAKFTENYQLRAHFLECGMPEKRDYICKIDEYELEYKRYIYENPNEHSDAPETFRCFLKSHGIASATWISKFNLGEFLLLNEAWLPTGVRSRMEALCLFVRHGIGRYAPISLNSRFDPDFHSQISHYRNRIERSKPYLDFLNVGIVLGEAGNEDAFLLDLIGENHFPTCFDVDAYRAAAGHLADRPAEGRARALAHYLQVGFPNGIRGVVSGAGAARLYEQIGKHHLIHGRFATALEALDCTIAARSKPSVRLPRARRRVEGSRPRAGGCARFPVRSRSIRCVCLESHSRDRGLGFHPGRIRCRAGSTLRLRLTLARFGTLARHGASRDRRRPCGDGAACPRTLPRRPEDGGRHSIDRKPRPHDRIDRGDRPIARTPAASRGRPDRDRGQSRSWPNAIITESRKNTDC